MRRFGCVLLTALLCSLPVSLVAQETPVSQAPAKPPIDTLGALRLFLDCQVSGCDFDYLRTEMTWVNYVRDRGVAQVHVMTSQLSTGSGGSEVTLKFIGLKEFTGTDEEVKYTTPQGATSDEDRREFTRVLQLGLVRYALRTPGGAHLKLNFAPPRVAAAPRQMHDPWNAWVFSLSINGFFNGESESKSQDFSGNVSANRVTKDWKSSFGFSGNKSKNEYALGDGDVYKADTHSYYASGLIVRSLGPKASAGATFSGSSSTQSNIDLRARFAPTFEYDFLGYENYTRKRLVLSYSIGVNRNDYTDTTIYNKTKETLLDQSLSLSYSARFPWGSANLGVSGFNYLDDFKKNRLGISGGMSTRLFKGFSLYYNASYNRIHDQITLVKSGYSDEEILLRLRQLRTSYSYYGSLGINYTFGSVFNNVVNPRMGGGGGGDECCHD